MKNPLKKIKINFLLFAILYILSLIIIHVVFFAFNLRFRYWVYIASVIIIGVSLILGILQLILKIKNKSIVALLILLLCIVLLYVTPVAFLICAFIYQPEYVVEKDNKKMVAYVNSFFDTYVEYYDYKNFLLVGSQIRIKEYYGKGGFDPIRNKFGNKFGNEYEVEDVIYYDEYGNEIKEKTEIKEEINNTVSKQISDSQNEINSNSIDKDIIDENNDKLVSEIEFTDTNTGYYSKDGEYYATLDGGATFKRIISKEKAADIAEEEAKKSKYQYQPWKSDFKARNADMNNAISAKLTNGLSEIDRLYYWMEDWKKEDYNDKIMWQIWLNDKNDPLTNLYIYISAEDGRVIGAGKSSD